jgi:hypothetical protein
MIRIMYTLQDINDQIIFGFVTHVCIRWRSCHRPSSISCPNGQASSSHSLVLRCRACTGTSEDSSHPVQKQTVFTVLVLRCRAYTGTSGISSHPAHKNRQFSLFNPAVPCLHRNIRGLFSLYTHTYSFHSLVLHFHADKGTPGSLVLRCRAYKGTSGALFVLNTYRQQSQFSPAVPCLYNHIISSCTHTDSFQSLVQLCPAHTGSSEGPSRTIHKQTVITV